MAWTFPIFKRSPSASDSASTSTDTSSTKSRRNIFRTMSSRESKHAQASAVEYQHAAIQEPIHTTNGEGRERDTGFPEPLNSDRNTTLPHPSADLSANATIIAPDIIAQRNSRSRSFLRNHSHSHKVSKSIEIPNGTITTMPGVDPERMYDGIEYADGSREGVNERMGSETGGGVNALGRLSAEGKGSESLSSEEGERKKGVLRKRMFS